MKNLRKVLFTFIVFITVVPASPGQQFFRMKADFSIKEKTAEGKERLTMGQVYYDKNSKKIVYNVRFPEKETWVIIDTSLYRIVGKEIKEVRKVPAIAEFSIFHLSLNGNIKDYGLKQSFYAVDKIEKEGDMVITTWKAPEKLSKVFGKVVMSQKERKLYGVVFFTPADVLVSKQFFKNYSNVNGLEFPTEIIQVTYIKNQENYQVTTYKNIIVDDMQEDNIYNYKLLAN